MQSVFPIESAPKDGTRILLYGDNRTHGYVPEIFEPDWYIGYWNRDYWDDDGDFGWIYDPTHWAPLPDIPNAKG